MGRFQLSFVPQRHLLTRDPVGLEAPQGQKLTHHRHGNGLGTEQELYEGRGVETKGHEVHGETRQRGNVEAEGRKSMWGQGSGKVHHCVFKG